VIVPDAGDVNAAPAKVSVNPPVGPVRVRLEKVATPEENGAAVLVSDPPVPLAIEAVAEPLLTLVTVLPPESSTVTAG
jgi:hypothetical protein